LVRNKEGVWEHKEKDRKLSGAKTWQSFQYINNEFKARFRVVMRCSNSNLEAPISNNNFRL
jgi:hypothetical protein